MLTIESLTDIVNSFRKPKEEFPPYVKCRNGRLTIDNKEFFQNPNIRKMINDISKSDIVKKINERNG